MTDLLVQRPISIPECFITDEIIVGMKDAILSRTIHYKNGTLSDFPINLENLILFYPHFCEDFEVKINDKIFDTKPSEKNFVQEIKIKHANINLAAGEDHKIIITCRWRDFYFYLNDLHFSFIYHEIAKYKLIIKNYSLSSIKHILEINGKEANLNDEYYILDSSIHFKEIEISPNNGICITLFSISTPKDLGIIKAIKDDNKSIFSDFTIILIQHLLSDVVHLIDAFTENGAEKDGLFIIGIPYSTKHQTVKYLRKKDFKNIVTPEQYPLFTDIVKDVMIKAIKYSKDKSKKIIVVEDGGYVMPLLHQDLIFKEDAKLFIGAVEQTANGIWRDKELKSKYKLKFLVPIVNVAESQIKKNLESPLIGRAVSKNIELVYNKSYRGIAGEEIGLVGFGSTGSQIALILKSIGAIVKVYDSKPIQRTDATNKGFEIVDSIKALVTKCNILIEATGDLWSKDSTELTGIILGFKHGSYFVSASSKRLGINYDIFGGLIHSEKTLNIPGVGVKYTLRNQNAHELTLIADGYPINFFLGESVPDRDIGFILAWLYKSAEIIALHYEELRPGVIDTDRKNDKWGFNEAQNRIAELHEKKIN